MQFVIANSKTLEDLYWSSDDGWTTLDKADRFNHAHTLLYQLPAGGFWMPLDDAIALDRVMRSSIKRDQGKTDGP